MSYSKEMIEAIQNEELDRANAFLEKALAEDSEEDLYALIETLYDLGFLAETKQVVTHLLTEFPDEDGLKITMAEIAIEQGSRAGGI
ncbi:MAG: hypothetical protein U5K84_11355 [Alkalibacterium sp.]|nr:hypothetical protein [Alkalibacterium sp.]